MYNRNNTHTLKHIRFYIILWLKKIRGWYFYAELMNIESPNIHIFIWFIGDRVLCLVKKIHFHDMS